MSPVRDDSIKAVRCEWCDWAQAYEAVPPWPTYEQAQRMIADHEATCREMHRDGYEAAVKEAHALLDAAGVPRATHARCDDPECNTQLGHRIRTMLKRRAE